MNDSVTVRRATADDVSFLGELVALPEVSAYLAAVRSATVGELEDEIARSQIEPEAFGVFVFEEGGERVGAATFERVNRRSRIASISGVALHPGARGRGVIDRALGRLLDVLFGDLEFHRVQLEVYAFNERAIRVFERAGFVREGVRRRAYWRNDIWVDGIMLGILAEEHLPST